MKLRKSLLCWAFLSPLLVLYLFPFLIMVLTAIKPREEVFAVPQKWFPSRIAFENFVDMWNAINFGPALLNSLYVSAVATGLTLLLSIPVAYALARFRFRARGLFSRFLLFTQMLSPIVLIIGLFRLAVALGINDTHKSLILFYCAFNIAFAVWMLQSYFATIPPDLEEFLPEVGCCLGLRSEP